MGNPCESNNIRCLRYSEHWGEKSRLKNAQGMQKKDLIHKGLFYSVMIVRLDSAKADCMELYERQQLMQSACYSIQAACNTKNLDCSVALRGIDVQLIFTWVDADRLTYEKWKIVLMIQQTLRRNVTGMQFLVGAGDICGDYSEIERSYQESVLEIENSRDISCNAISDISISRSWRFLNTPKSTDDMILFSSSVIGSLLDYDLPRGGELVKTLSAYFKYSGNVMKMSKNLYTHYNTTLNRLKRIQEITGMDLQSEDDRYCLHTSLKIMKYLDVY